METPKALLPVDNAVFNGGFGLAVLATGAQLMRSGAGAGAMLLKRQFLVTLEVTSKDKSYPWVLAWLARQGKRTQHLSVETSITASARGASTVFGFVPGPGQHFLAYKGQVRWTRAR